MAFDNFSELITHISIDSILSGDLTSILPTVYLIVLIAIYSILIWHFYRFIAQRDCFKIPSGRHPRIINIFKYFLVFPLVAFLFFLGFSLMMLFLTRSYEIPVVLSTSFAIIVAIRLTAYYSGDLSKDVAKMLPFALLGLFLVDPSYFSFEQIIEKVNSLPEFFNLCIQFILFIVLVEWILRISLTTKNSVLNIIENKHYTRNELSKSKSEKSTIST